MFLENNCTMIKVVNIIGARPQFIKYFSISNAIKQFNKENNLIENILVHTGQHYDYCMSKVFFDELGIKEPDYHLDVGSGSHGEQTGRIIQKVEEVLLKINPDIVLVYGDTNSTLGGALAAAKLKIPVAHIEAGLRSFNKNMPEEINRVLTDHVSTILFCPTENAVKNLTNEGFKNVFNNGKLVPSDHFHHDVKKNFLYANRNKPIVINVGDVMYDVLKLSLKIAEKRSKILETLRLDSKRYNLLTIHRSENTNFKKNFEKIVNFVNGASREDIVIFPMHPGTEKIYKITNKKFSENIKIINPVGYFDMLILLRNCKLVMTDSGGMQKEAFLLKVPCITLRDETEWIETVKSGWNVLFKNYQGIHKKSNMSKKYFGDGKAAERIIKILLEWNAIKTKVI